MVVNRRCIGIMRPPRSALGTAVSSASGYGLRGKPGGRSAGLGGARVGAWSAGVGRLLAAPDNLAPRGGGRPYTVVRVGITRRPCPAAPTTDPGFEKSVSSAALPVQSRLNRLAYGLLSA